MPAPRRPGLVARPAPAPAPTAPAPASIAVPAPAGATLPAVVTVQPIERQKVIIRAKYVLEEGNLEPPLYKTFGKGGVLLGGAILLAGAVLIAILLVSWGGLYLMHSALGF